ncbi:uncharacterized protein KGF55_003313 [Candida pseudojiufengensis]|uniref:uncharacterized protein n=1 Tax=Candida pseudojiufengensis TaxID=497109 RepID=UPI0022257EA1|nr:uncharacterized protein KGF55_003313 [Candida pseudojiufengensis]KAI5962237.1 hypothetical protein KGF55_003313 [Candida pseudojiufengensis]
MSIRPLHHITYSTLRSISKQNLNNVGTKNLKLTRSIYLHKGPRIEGLKKDPKEVFINSSGIEYGLNDENIKYIKSYLGESYKIPDEIALQIITHKSFGNGIKPYNEKLAAMGSKLLNLSLAKHVISISQQNNNSSQSSSSSTSPSPLSTSSSSNPKLHINGLNLSILGSPTSKELSSRKSTGYFAKFNNLNKIMFWKSRNPTLGFESSGELKVSSQLIYSLVGAVNYYYGKSKAEEFINEKLVDKLTDITSDIVNRV